MTTPARNHYLRACAALAAQGQQDADSLRDATGYELMLAQLAEHKRQLKLVQSVERKAEVKRRMLPEYAAWVAGVLDADSGVQDDVFMTVMLWYIDVGDLLSARCMADYAIRHKLAMPDQYQRTTACLIAEEFAHIALKAIEAGDAADLDALMQVAALVQDHDMPDEVRAKLYKAIGYAQLAHIAGESQPPEEAEARRAAALEFLKRALALHEKCGVKKDIERLEREIKNAAKGNTQS